MEGTWTILELAERAAETLAVPVPVAAHAHADPPAKPHSSAAEPHSSAAEPDGSAARANGRVRDVPNERLIRWYATVGLMDPPLSRRGRVAQYGQRHLLQLVAVKRRQAEGRSLAEIQAELAGATDEVLADIACLPDDDHNPTNQSTAAIQDGGTRAAPDRFWTRRPGEQLAAAASRDDQPTQPDRDDQPAQPDRGDRPDPGAEPDRGRPGLVHGVSLAPGVVLLLEGTDRAPSPDDITAIVNAARPLLEELADRGLSASGPDNPPGP